MIILLNLIQNLVIFEFVSRDTLITIVFFVLALLMGFILSNKVPFKLVLTFKPLPEFSLETVDNYTEKYSEIMDKLNKKNHDLETQNQEIAKLKTEIAGLEVTNSTLEEEMKGKEATIKLQDGTIERLNEQLNVCHENFNTVSGVINLLDGRNEAALQCTVTGDIECYNKVAMKWELERQEGKKEENVN